jgi:hypothetical protein
MSSDAIVVEDFGFGPYQQEHCLQPDLWIKFNIWLNRNA